MIRIPNRHVPNRRIVANPGSVNRRPMKLPGAISCLLLCILWPSIVGGETLGTRLSASERLDNFLGQVNTLTLNFQQTLVDEEGKILEEATGIAYIERPRRFRWEYQNPYRQTIVSDGDNVWFHDHELAQVIVKSWDSFAMDAPAAILTTDRPLSEMFDIEDLPAKEDHTVWQWVRLTPKSTDTNIASAEVGFGETGLDVMKFVDNFGQKTWLVFSGLNINRDLNPRFFSFTPPPGVDIVGEDGKVGE